MIRAIALAILEIALMAVTSALYPGDEACEYGKIKTGTKTVNQDLAWSENIADVIFVANPTIRYEVDCGKKVRLEPSNHPKITSCTLWHGESGDENYVLSNTVNVAAITSETTETSSNTFVLKEKNISNGKAKRSLNCHMKCNIISSAKVYCP